MLVFAVVRLVMRGWLGMASSDEVVRRVWLDGDERPLVVSEALYHQLRAHGFEMAEFRSAGEVKRAGWYVRVWRWLRRRLG